MNFKKLCVLDFESLSVNPRTTEIIQISALMVDPVKLEIIPDSEFNSYIQPPSFTTDDIFYNKWKSTIEWHLKNQGWTREQFIDKLATAPPESVVFPQFVDYYLKYNNKQGNRTIFSAPILTAWNLFGFDKIILDNLCKKYKITNKDGEQNLYLDKECQDIMKIMWWWFENSDEIKGQSMDAAREYFGISMANAHEGMKDVKDEAAILIRFLKLHRLFTKKVNFKNSFAKQEKVLI